VRPLGVGTLFDSASRAIWGRFTLELVDALYPPVCALCSSRDVGDGLGCALHRLPTRLLGPRCGRCARALPPSIADRERCAECRARSPGFERLLALADYRAQPAIQPWILALKYGRRADLARTLGAVLGARWMVSEASEESAVSVSPALLVPVPLHRLRRLERGYDQSLLVARAVADVTGLRVVPALRRVRSTLVQGAPGSPSRTANVANAFAPAMFGERRIRGAAAWIVDDVVTSGATAAECARVVRGIGAASVGVLALARASS
jgi:predicted amidophosphoribosyltransferase